MNTFSKSFNTINIYHEQTKHRANRYAKSLGYMDWANKPDPFRSYQGVETIPLRNSFQNGSASYADVMAKRVPPAPLCKEAIAQFVQYAMGIMAYKSYGEESWALRANASSGNLQPTEMYLMLEKNSGFDKGLYHYVIEKHGLSKLSEDFVSNIKEGSFVVALTSIFWREIWKYGERAFRYTQLDLGHAYGALLASAKTLGWQVHLLDGFSQTDMEKIVGLDDTTVYNQKEKEYANIFIMIETKEVSFQNVELEVTHVDRKANILSDVHVAWPIIDEVINACYSPASKKERYMPVSFFSDATVLMLEVIKKRRSAQMFHPAFVLDAVKFNAILYEASELIEGFEVQSKVLLVVTVNRVDGIPSGIYLVPRDGDDIKRFKHQTSKVFDYGAVELQNITLYKLEEGDFSTYAQSINCTQAIAKDAAFTVAMFTYFEQTLEKEPTTYKSLYNICGMIGQQMYLSATSVGVQATGIGCYLDDAMPELLGVENSGFRDLYHLSVGQALVDNRLQTKEPDFKG